MSEMSGCVFLLMPPQTQPPSSPLLSGLSNSREVAEACGQCTGDSFVNGKGPPLSSLIFGQAHSPDMSACARTRSHIF